MIIAFRVTNRETAWLSQGRIHYQDPTGDLDFEPRPEAAAAQSKGKPAPASNPKG